MFTFWVCLLFGLSKSYLISIIFRMIWTIFWALPRSLRWRVWLPTKHQVQLFFVSMHKAVPLNSFYGIRILILFINDRNLKCILITLGVWIHTGFGVFGPCMVGCVVKGEELLVGWNHRNRSKPRTSIP